MGSLQELHVKIPEDEVTAIEYPGFVRNSDRALQTLGGLNAIAAAVSSKQHLRLRHRPEDRTSHPLFGERVEAPRLLLRIARRKPQQQQHDAPAAAAAAPAPGSPQQQQQQDAVQPETSNQLQLQNANTEANGATAEDGGEVTVSVVARVTPTFRFSGLADFVYLPTDPLLHTRTRDGLPFEQRAARAEPTRAVQPLLLVPQLFSWLDMPQDYAFRQLQPKAGRGAKGMDTHWGDSPIISFYAGGGGAVQLAAVVERVVQRLCYRFKTGPWRGLYIRRGYDPRADVEARKYQAISYTLPSNWYRTMLRAGTLPNPLQPQQQQQQEGTEGQAAADGAPPTQPQPRPAAAPPVAPTMEDLHNFRALPTTNTTTFQILDLKLPEAQQALQEPLSTFDSIRCTEKNGWMSHSTLTTIQNAVSQKFLRLMDQLAPPGVATGAAAEGDGDTTAKERDGGATAGGDVDMADAADGAAAGGGTAAGVKSKDGPADDALRMLMEQMSLRGAAAAGGGGGGAAAGIAGGEDDGGGVDVSALFGDDGDEEGEGMDEDGHRRGGDAGRRAAAAAAAAGEEQREGGAAASGGDDGGADAGDEEDAPPAEGYRSGDESAYESEYDIGAEDEEEEEDLDDDEELGGGAGAASMAPARYGEYGRVLVPYGEEYDGAAGAGGGGYGGGMFGSDEDDLDEYS